MGVELKSKKWFKCLCCNEVERSEPRSVGRQRYCGKEACRKASKAASQRRWVERPENAGYFRGKENCERVRRWRAAHPGYWKKKPGEGGKRDERRPDEAQATEGKPVEACEEECVALQDSCAALQEVCAPQVALLVGLISILIGDAQQDAIAASARRFLGRGRDILSMRPGGYPIGEDHENKDDHLPREGEARAAPV